MLAYLKNKDASVPADVIDVATIFSAIHLLVSSYVARGRGILRLVAISNTKGRQRTVSFQDAA